jgi:acyl-CoA thioesterase-2
VPIDYEVEATRDGRSFSTRRVLASQNAEVIFETSVSFHAREGGSDYQAPIDATVPAPDDTPKRFIFVPDEAAEHLPMEMRELGPVGPDEHGWYPSSRRAWMKMKRPLPDDPIVHQCVLTYLSDMGAVFAAIEPSANFTFGSFMGASLDHAMWFHRPLRADEWYLYDLQSLSNAGSRGLARGTMHAADGTLGVSVAQEALLRAFDPSRRRSS